MDFGVKKCPRTVLNILEARGMLISNICIKLLHDQYLLNKPLFAEIAFLQVKTHSFGKMYVDKLRRCKCLQLYHIIMHETRFTGIQFQGKPAGMWDHSRRFFESLPFETVVRWSVLTVYRLCILKIPQNNSCSPLVRYNHKFFRLHCSLNTFLSSSVRKPAQCYCHVNNKL